MKKILFLLTTLLILLPPCMTGAATFYVCDTEADCEAGALADTDWVTGNDGNAGTSKATALKTTQAAIDKCTAGQVDTVIVGAGTYTCAGCGNFNSFNYDYGGTDVDNPWVIRAETISNTTPEVCFDGDQNLTSTSAFRFNNGSRWIKLQGFEIKDFTWYGVLVATGSYDITIDQCVIHGNHAWADDDGTYGVGLGIYTSPETRDMTVTRTKFYDNGRGFQDGINDGGCGHDFGHDHHIYLRGSGHEIYNCIFYDANAGWAISMRGWSGVDDGKPSLILENNTFYGSGYDFGEAVCGTYGSKGFLHTYSNWIQEPGTGSEVHDGGPRDTIIRNNVFFLPPQGAVFDGDLEYYRCEDFWESMTWENNVTTSADWWWNMGPYGGVTPNWWVTHDETDFLSYSGNYDGTTTPSILDHADLGMTDPTNNDFTLTASAFYLINSGTATGAPADDYIGTARPQDVVDDVGAYEHIGTSVEYEAVWNFEDGALTVDSAGDYTLTNVNTVVSSATHKEGSHSADFTVANEEYFTRTGTVGDFGLGTTNQFTLCAWIQLDDIGVEMDLFGKGSVGGSDLDFSIYIPATSSPRACIGHTGGTSGECEEFVGGDFVADRWYHFCTAVNDSGETVEGLDDQEIRIRIWDDTAGDFLGAPAEEEILPYTSHWEAGTGGDFFIGSEGAAAGFWDGLIDGMRLYNRVLSSADMDALRSSAAGPATISAFFHCNAAKEQIAIETTYNADDPCYLCAQASGGSMFMSEGPISNIKIGTDMTYPDNEEWEYSSGMNTNIIRFGRVIQIGDRDLDLQAEGTAEDTGLIHGATLLTDVGATEITYTLPQADPAGGNIIISAPYPSTSPKEFTDAADYTAWLLAGNYTLPTDHYIWTEAADTDGFDASGEDGTAGNEINYDGQGFPVLGSQIFGDYSIIQRFIHGSTVELGLGDTHKYSLIPVGDILKVPEGATGCTIHDDSIPGTLDLDEQVGADTLGGELVTDGGIEAWTGDNPDNLKDTATPTVTDEAVIIHAGAHSCKVVADAAYDGVVEEAYNAVTAGTLYKSTFWIYGDGAGEVLARVRQTNAAFATIDFTYFPGMAAGDGFIPPAAWNEHTLYFTAEPTVVWVKLEFMSDAGASGTFYIDDYSIKAVTSTTGIFNTWITTVDLAGLGIEEVALFRNCAFVQSEATIEATLPTATLEDETGATEMRGSFVDGQAWFHDAGGLIAAFADTGNLIIVNDGSGNLAQGYLGEVGTGETLGAEIITDATNRDFSGAGDWIAGGAATVTVNYDSTDVGHTTTMRVEAGDATLETADLPSSTAYPLTAGKTYKFSFDYKDVESTNVTPVGRVRILTVGGGDTEWDLAVSAVWVTETIYFTSETTGNLRILFYANRNAGHADNETLFDTVSLKEVTEPAATAVIVYKEHSLTTEGWLTIAAGIDYNADAAWDFDIYNYGTVWFDDECQFSITTADCFRDYAGADYHLTAGSPLKDAGEVYLNITNLDTSDFSAGVDNYGGTRMHTFTGDHDAVSDGVTSKDNCLMGAADAVDNTHYSYIFKANNGMSDQIDFKLTYSFYVPAAQTHTDGMQVRFQNGGWTTLATHEGINGTWTTNTVRFSAAESTVMTIAFWQMDGSDPTFIGDNDGAGDLLYLKDIAIGYDAGGVDLEGRITPIGAGHDIGAYELRKTGESTSMSLGLSGYCPHRVDD